jgi:ATP-binding cassette subfamily F protein 3
VIAEELKLRSGDLWKAPGTLEGHFGQTNIERLHPQNTVVQEILGVNDELSATAVRGICGSMMFSGDDADKSVSVLSGGEKARVMLGKILAKKTNLLYLDEPTNHLDLESIEVLCDEIAKFKGCVFLVTHSELLLSRLVNKLIIFREGKANFFEGTYQDFLEKVGWDDELPEKVKKEKVIEKKTPKKEKTSVNEHKVLEIEQEIIRLEQMISKFENLCQVKSSQGEEIREITDTLLKLHEKVDEKFLELESLV